MLRLALPDPANVILEMPNREATDSEEELEWLTVYWMI